MTAAQLIGDQGSLVAMDVLPASVEAVAGKVRAANLKNVRVMQGDALNTKAGCRKHGRSAVVRRAACTDAASGPASTGNAPHIEAGRSYGGVAAELGTRIDPPIGIIYIYLQTERRIQFQTKLSGDKTFSSRSRIYSRTFSFYPSVITEWEKRSRPERTPAPSENEYGRGLSPAHIHFSGKPLTGR